MKNLIKFNPELPNSKHIYYLDTSILHPLTLQRNNPLGKAILGAISSYCKKIVTCDYAVYELKRSILGALDKYCVLLIRDKDVEVARVHLNTNYSPRETDVVSALITTVLQRSPENSSWQIILRKLQELSLELENHIKSLSKHRIQSKNTGCKLHNPTITDHCGEFFENVTCNCECTVEKFWKSKKNSLNILKNYTPLDHDSSKTKKWFEKYKPKIEKLLSDPNWGRGKQICLSLGDMIIFLHADKKYRILSRDHSFIAMAKATGHIVHQMNSDASILGGQANRVIREAGENSREVVNVH